MTNDDPVLQTVPLGSPPWPTIDPFLFCVHHLDAYPEGTIDLGPDPATLAGRDIGQDFSGTEGWNMYHGDVVPGFPQHPHRGFETVTYVRQGTIDHSDSLGAAARFGGGDTQWVTAGNGIVHSEMFPLLDGAGPNPLELFQIWLNLPAEDKLVDPHFTMLWSEETPRHVVVGPDGATAEVTVVAGSFAGLEPPSPPPSSWASRADADLAIWHIHLDGGASIELPPAQSDETIRTLYVFDGSSLHIGSHDVPKGTALVVRVDAPVEITGGEQGVDVLVLQGRPIGEPVAQYGPFVMNTEDEIRQAFADYRRSEFGGWPWDADAPHHGPTRGRFARHADGTLDEREPATTP